MIRLLIVDDSAFARYSISRLVSADGGIEILGFARDGVEALEKASELRPDVITLDVEMPRLNGLETLERLMAETPTPVIMVSSLTGQGTDCTIRALEIGAVDYFLKASSANPVGSNTSQEELNTKIRMAAKVGRTGIARIRTSLPLSLPRREKRAPRPSKAGLRKVVVVASSTGGPGALHQVVPLLPENLPAAVVLVQHMPPGFTKSLAARLDELSMISVVEASPGSRLAAGQAMVAPGGYHLVFDQGGIARLSTEPAVLGLRPAADITMSSIVRLYGKAVVGAVLTGMGSDGTSGAMAIKAAGGHVVAQDEETSVVYGMPRCVVEAQVADYVVPLPKIAETITKLCRE